MLAGSFALPPSFESPIPTCMVYALYKVPCPLCGMTRAMMNLCHGHLEEALRFHPAVLLVFPALLMGWIGSVRRDVTGREAGTAWRRVSNVVGWATFLAVAGYGIARYIGVVALGMEPW